MIIFKVLLIILLSAPVIAAAAFLYMKARGYSIKLNREEKYNDMQYGRDRRFR